MMETLGPSVPSDARNTVETNTRCKPPACRARCRERLCVTASTHPEVGSTTYPPWREAARGGGWPGTPEMPGWALPAHGTESTSRLGGTEPGDFLD